MAMEYSYNVVLEHVELNNMLLAAKGWGVMSGLAVSERGAGANMSVDVASGNCFVDDVKHIESSTVNVAISTAHATLARKDIIIYDTSAGNPAAVTGTPAAIPVPPDIPVGDILLALVNVVASDGTIDNADIVDKIIIVVPSGFVVDGTKVFDTTAPTTWTDLDLSSYVGASQVVVLLKVKNMNVGLNELYAFRKNGDTDSFFYASGIIHCGICSLGPLNAGYVTVITDTGGVIEYTTLNGRDTDIWLEGYWLTR